MLPFVSLQGDFLSPAPRVTKFRSAFDVSSIEDALNRYENNNLLHMLGEEVRQMFRDPFFDIGVVRVFRRVEGRLHTHIVCKAVAEDINNGN